MPSFGDKKSCCDSHHGADLNIIGIEKTVVTRRPGIVKLSRPPPIPKNGANIWHRLCLRLAQESEGIPPFES